jgi:hypothetical protein
MKRPSKHLQIFTQLSGNININIKITKQQKITVGFNDLLLTEPGHVELLHADLSGQHHEHLPGGDDARGPTAMRGSVGIPVSHAPQKIFLNTYFVRAVRLDVFPTEVWQAAKDQICNVLGSVQGQASF